MRVFVCSLLLLLLLLFFSFLLFMNQIRIQIHPIRRSWQNESASGLLGAPRLFFSLLRRRGFKKIDDNSPASLFFFFSLSLRRDAIS